MFVNQLDPGCHFLYAGVTYIKVRPKYNEELVLEVKNDNKTYGVSSQDRAAVNLETGELEFIHDEVEFLKPDIDNPYTQVYGRDNW